VWVGGNGVQALYYAGDEDWAVFNEFNGARGKLHATPRLDQARTNQALLDGIGWSRADLDMFRLWFYMDESLYTAESLDAIAAATEFSAGPASRWIDPLFDQKWPQSRLVVLGLLFVTGMGWVPPTPPCSCGSRSGSRCP
jgi:hypothetical protein